MPLGKDRAGRTVGPSSAQRSYNAKVAARYPLRRVIDSGIGLSPEFPNLDVDALECGHYLSGAQDLVGRRYPGRRRCYKCGDRPDWTEPD